MDYQITSPPDTLTVKEALNGSPLALPREERPRERLMRFGPEALSDRDLLSIVLVSGVHGTSVSHLAEKLLGKLDEAKTIPQISELRGMTGMGDSKACTIAAMLEFGRRKWASGRRIKHPGDIYDLIKHYAGMEIELKLKFNVVSSAVDPYGLRIIFDRGPSFNQYIFTFRKTC